MPLAVAIFLGFLVLAGCGSSGSSSSVSTAPAVSVPAHNASTLQVYVFVLTRPDGTGNEAWTAAYAQAMLDASADFTARVATIQLALLTRVVDVSYDTETMALVYAHYLAYAVTGAVVVVIAPPGVPSGWGTAVESAFPGSKRPYLVMRRKTDQERQKQLGGTTPLGSHQDAVDLAEIFLHELGHNIGFPENAPATPLNADTWYVQQPEALRDYARYLATF